MPNIRVPHTYVQNDTLWYKTVAKGAGGGWISMQKKRVLFGIDTSGPEEGCPSVIRAQKRTG